MNPIHYQLEKAGIKHICHYKDANAVGMFDLSLASIICTECRIDRGEFTLADILLGRIDPMDRQKAVDESARRSREDRQLRLSGKLPKHVVYTAYQKFQDGKEISPKSYERYDCELGRGSASSTLGRICTFCKESIDL